MTSAQTTEPGPAAELPDDGAVTLVETPISAVPAAEDPAPAADDEPTRTVRRWQRLFTPRRVDLLVLAGYAAGAGWLFAHLLTGPRSHYLSHSTSDQRAFEYFFAWMAKALTHGLNPFFMPIQNAPDGVNAMGNTVVFALSVPLTPVTLAFGPSVSFLIGMVVGMTASAWAWYWLFSRVVTVNGAPVSRLAAALGGGFVAYAPSMVSQANGHMNMVVNFALPVVIGLTLRLARERAHRIRRGLLLGLFAAIQIMIGEEILAIAALGLATFLILYALQRPAQARAAWPNLLVGGAVALAVAVPLVAYPLWFQFFGPQHYSGLPLASYRYADVLSYPNFSTQSIAGLRGAADPYSLNGLTEENGFFGWPLAVLAVGLAGYLWRNVVARTAALTSVVFVLLSLGNQVHVAAHRTPIPGPWRELGKLPLLDSLLPSRLAFVVVPMIALLLIVATERVRAAAPRAEARGLPLRKLWVAALAVALVPILPLPLPGAGRVPVPAFFSDGTWRQYVSPGGVVVGIPLTRSPFNTYAFDWQIAADLDFRIAGGYFVGPRPADEHGPAGHGWYDQDPRPTDLLLSKVRTTGPVPVPTAQDKANFLIDARFWHAQALVMDPATAPQPDRLRHLVDEITGVTGRSVDGVVVWDVRPLSGA